MGRNGKMHFAGGSIEEETAKSKKFTGLCKNELKLTFLRAPGINTLELALTGEDEECL